MISSTTPPPPPGPNTAMQDISTPPTTAVRAFTVYNLHGANLQDLNNLYLRTCFGGKYVYSDLTYTAVTRSVCAICTHFHEVICGTCKVHERRKNGTYVQGSSDLHINPKRLHVYEVAGVVVDMHGLLHGTNWDQCARWEQGAK